ncbi:RNA polymerase sigma-70 factor, sigma-E family [Streptomyces pini]|uniref:RNA polymerase sigma-70 factor, sigma-E family n=1 Tax=Streptomyces pini TaxID=1520580 RepID=A0A1I4J1L9_9ACTN|nr:RNA polymerase sigma-70 factor, sigma-E family [Streptomyces pini]
MTTHGTAATVAPLTFTSYVRARGPVLLRTARSLTSNPSDAEDLLQTALTKTYLAWERIEDQRALDGYVRRALVNTRTSQWRKRRVDEYSCEELPEPDPVPGPDPAEQQAVRDAVWRAVLALPERQRAMVTLRYYEDLSEAQTAAVLGVSVGTVKSAVSRALAKLREDPRLLADVLGGGGAERGTRGVGETHGARGARGTQGLREVRVSAGGDGGDLRGLRGAGDFEGEAAVAA